MGKGKGFVISSQGRASPAALVYTPSKTTATEGRGQRTQPTMNPAMPKGMSTRPMAALGFISPNSIVGTRFVHDGFGKMHCLITHLCVLASWREICLRWQRGVGLFISTFHGLAHAPLRSIALSLILASFASWRE